VAKSIVSVFIIFLMGIFIWLLYDELSNYFKTKTSFIIFTVIFWSLVIFFI